MAHLSDYYTASDPAAMQAQMILQQTTNWWGWYYYNGQWMTADQAYQQIYNAIRAQQFYTGQTTPGAVQPTYANAWGWGW